MKNNQLIEDLQIQLARCAGKWRAALPDSIEDKEVLAEYYKIFDELIYVNGGIIGLDLDAELSGKLMPEAYVNFWKS